MSVNSQHGRRVFALEVGGLEYRYHSGAGTSGLDANIATGISYNDVEAIVSVSSYSSSLDMSGGTAQYSSTTVTLAIDRRRGGAGDPGIIFGRCGARSASLLSQVSSTVEREATTISVVKDMTSLSYPRLLHIGAETVRVSSATATDLTVSDRAVGNTPHQLHSIDLEGSFVPEVSAEITTFRGRRAKLYAAHRYPSGELSSWVEVVNGIIETSPDVEDDAINVSIVPLTALIDTSLSDKGNGQTSLLDGYHYYGIEANTLEYGIKIDTALRSRYSIDLTSTATASTISLFGDQSIIDDFDATLPDGSVDVDYNGVPHPRYPRLSKSISLWDKFLFPNTISATTNASGLNVFTCALTSRTESFNSAEIQADLGTLEVDSLLELKQHELGSEEVKLWPDVINETLESDGPSSTQGLAGGLVKWRLNGTREAFVSRLSNTRIIPQLWLWASKQGLIDAARADTHLDHTKARYWPNANSARPLASDRSRVWYPLNIGQGRSFDNRSGRRRDVYNYGGYQTLNAPLEPPRTGSSFSVDIPSAYFQIFEDRILVEDSLGLPTSAGSTVYDVLVRFTKFPASGSQSLEDQITAGEQFDQVFQATHESVATYGGSNIGYFIHLDPEQDLSDNESFANWPNSERVLIYRASRLSNDRPGVAILKLLESGGGDGVNGTYDVFQAGLNIDSSHIDEQSFLTVDSTALATIDTFISGDSADVRKLVDSILQMLGATIVMKRDATTGESKLTLVSLAAELRSKTSLAINAGDWLTDPPPSWGTVEDIVTQIEFEYDYDLIEQDYQSNVIINNQEAINRYGGERAKITLTLPGLISDDFGRGAGDRFAQFLPISQRIFNILSNPLRVWRGSIGSGQSIYLDVGSYVTVSSPHLKGYSDSYGVTEQIGMITAIRQELMSEGCELEIVTTGLAPVAWNATARVTSITPQTATVAADDFSSSDVDDVSFFQVGDVVDYLPRGNHDGAITGLEIQSITGNTIEFTTNHGISSLNGTLEPTTYANASANHRSDAYLANASDILNTTVDAQEYS